MKKENISIFKSIAIMFVIVAICVGSFLGVYFGVVKPNSTQSSQEGKPSMSTNQDQTGSGNDKTDNNQSTNDNTDKTDDKTNNDQLDNKIDIPPIKKTELDYMKECEERIEQIALEKLQSTSKRATFGNVEIVKINKLDGTVYLTADTTFGGKTVNDFYKFSLGKSLTQTTYQEAVEVLNEISPLETTFEIQYILKGKIPEELYDKLIAYILGEVGLEDAEVLNATEFHSDDRGARNQTILTLVKDNKVYYVKAITSSLMGSQINHANYMLNSKTNTIRITGEENFSEFIIMSESETAV